MAPVCPTCGSDRSPLPAGARFCPRCGGSFPEDPAAIVSSLSPGDSAATPVLPAFAEESRSAILLGFANALYRLGWRYETGVGAWRNPAEAFRCYGKSAKLGNAAAAERVRDNPGTAADSRMTSDAPR